MPAVIDWLTDIHATGIGYGFSVMDRMSRAAFEAAGGIVQEGAPWALQTGSIIGVPDIIPNRKNALFTTWESPVIPPVYLERIRKFDVVITTARFLCEALRNYFPDKPIYRVPLGIDPNIFYPAESWPNSIPFTFLWTGALTGRKGYNECLEAWKGVVLKLRTKVRLWIKTTRPREEGKIEVQENIVIDTRNLPDTELASLMRSCHVGVFPTWGEGWGLLIHEAMACGLPCIVTDWGGHRDYATGVVIPLKWHMDAATNFDPEGKVLCPLARPDTLDLAWQMILSTAISPHNLRRLGMKAAERARQFTWDNTGRRLVAIIREFAV